MDHGTILDYDNHGMGKRWFYMVILLMAGAIGLHAQERVDTVILKPKPLITSSLFSGSWQPIFPSLEGMPSESKEQRVARINQEIYERVMASVEQNLSWHRPAKLSQVEMALLFVGGLFLNSPYKFRPGKFPQCISTEYDFRTGTYQQVMIKWNEVERSMARSYGGPYRNDPVPKMKFRSDEWMIP